MTCFGVESKAFSRRCARCGNIHWHKPVYYNLLEQVHKRKFPGSLSFTASLINVIKFLDCPYFRLSSECVCVWVSVAYKSMALFHQEKNVQSLVPMTREIVFRCVLTHTYSKMRIKHPWPKGFHLFVAGYLIWFCVLSSLLRWVVLDTKMNFIKNANKDMADILVGKQGFFICECVCDDKRGKTTQLTSSVK